MNKGIFTISLDFELYWGLIDQKTIEKYGQNIKNVQKVVPKLLQIFNQYNIHSTWASVGFLFFKNEIELRNNYPKFLPNYSNPILSPYQYLENNINIDPIYHFGSDLIDLITGYNGQEIGTHTFSHYYCLENGQSIDEFEEDIKLAISSAKKMDISIESIVFPRNQYSKKYLQMIEKHGIKSYRGNQKNWIYNQGAGKNQTYLVRIIRLIDSYLNISGHNTYSINSTREENLYNFPASAFLRPYNSKINFLEQLKLKRIKKSMTYAAKNNQIYHLWWHPHNFGKNLDKNLNFLQSLLNHFQYLNKKYKMESLNMMELSTKALDSKNY